MTEIIVGPMPENFEITRAAAHYNEITKEKYADHPAFLFILTTKETGSISLVAAFKNAVDTEETIADISAVVKEEIKQCGRDPERWPRAYHTFSRNIFPTLIQNFQNWNP